jgi:acyl-CoA dehydrogenase
MRSRIHPVGTGDTATQLLHAQEAGILSSEEVALVLRRNHLRDKAIAVDDFPHDFSVAAA